MLGTRSIMTAVSVAFASFSLLVSPVESLAAATYWKDIPDFFQHQKWGSGVADPGGDVNWEGGTRAGGWCYYASVLDQFYFFKKKGFAGLLPNAITADGTWLNSFGTELPKFVDDWGTLPNPNAADKIYNDQGHVILRDRGAGPRKGIKDGLIRCEVYQSGADVRYKSADGNDKKLLANKKLVEYIPTVHKAGDCANLRMTYRAGSPKLWWSGPNPDTQGHFHAVAVGGFDIANKKLWFNDPDSNPDPGMNDGNKNANAGWSGAVNQAPNANPTKKRRFQAGDALPIAGDAPGANDITKRLFEADLDPANINKYKIAAADFDRYDKVLIEKINTLEVVSAANDPAAPLVGSPYVFQVSPAQVGTLPIDEFWLYPGDDVITSVTLADSGPADWTDTLTIGAFVDNLGNSRPFGGLHVVALGGLKLYDLDVLEFEYTTESGLPLAHWDVLLNDRTDSLGLRVQVFGGDIDQVVDQVPYTMASSVDPNDAASDGMLQLDVASVVRGGETVRIRYALADRSGPASLSVFDSSGRLVRNLNASSRGEGATETSWDQRNSSGRLVARGQYFLRLSSGDQQVTRKVLIHD